MQGPEVSLPDYKKAIDDMRLLLQAKGMPQPDNADLAIQFIYGLDRNRYDAYINALENDANMRGTELPQTMESAFLKASVYKTAGVRKDKSGNLQSVFVLCDDVKSNMQKDIAVPVPRQRTLPTATTAPKKSAATSAQQAPRYRATAAAATSATAAAAAAHKRPEKACYLCKEVGHIMSQCPHNPFNVNRALYTVVGELDDQDDYAVIEDEYSSTFITDEVCLTTFSKRKVYIDSQASRSVFCEKDLLKNIRAAKPYTMGGVNSKSPGLHVHEQGDFEDFGPVSYHVDAAANILSLPRLRDAGHLVEYDSELDLFVLDGKSRKYVFHRMRIAGEPLAVPHYACEMSLVATVADNERRFTVREVEKSRAATELLTRLGYASTRDGIALADKGIANCNITATDIRIAHTINGIQLGSLRGKTSKKKSAVSAAVAGRRVVQVEQICDVDLFFINNVVFLMGILSPLGLLLVACLSGRSAAVVGKGLLSFLSLLKSRNFDVVTLRCDGEGAVGKLAPDLQNEGVTVDTTAAGEHVPRAENGIKTIKQRVRAHSTSLPFVMTRLMLIYCVMFCVSRLNLLPSSTCLDHASPTEQFTGVKLDYKRDLRCGFGDYVQATVPDPDNSLKTRTQGCIAMLPTGNSTGSVKMYSLATKAVVKRNQFTVLPMPDLVIDHITEIALSEGITRESLEIDLPPQQSMTAEDRAVDDAAILSKLPSMMRIDGREPVVEDVDDNSESGDDTGATADTEDILPPSPLPSSVDPDPGRRLKRAPAWHADYALIMCSKDDAVRAELRKQLVLRQDWHDSDFAFTISVKAALRERGAEAMPVILAELQQMVDKKVWHGISTKGMSHAERKSIIRSSMFLKDKYFASGAFDRFKARLVAGGDQQDKGLYEDLSSPTAATTSVLTVAAIAAAEGRHVFVTDIGGAFLNASLQPTGVIVRMRLNQLMTTLLVQIDPSYAEFVEQDGTVVVELDKALYGCVEASLLWYRDLKDKLEGYGFVANPYDACVFNMTGASGSQITVVIHVDDLLSTCASADDLEAFAVFLKSMYKETRTNRGLVLDYIGMTFDFSVKGRVSVTMDNCINDILSGCGVTQVRATPGTSDLFDVREAPKVSIEDSKYFHSYVMKLMYLAKRVQSVQSV